MFDDPKQLLLIFRFNKVIVECLEKINHILSNATKIYSDEVILYKEIASNNPVFIWLYA